MPAPVALQEAADPGIRPVVERSRVNFAAVGTSAAWSAGVLGREGPDQMLQVVHCPLVENVYCHDVPRPALELNRVPALTLAVDADFQRAKACVALDGGLHGELPAVHLCNLGASNSHEERKQVVANVRRGAARDVHGGWLKPEALHVRHFRWCHIVVKSLSPAAQRRRCRARAGTVARETQLTGKAKGHWRLPDGWVHLRNVSPLQRVLCQGAIEVAAGEYLAASILSGLLRASLAAADLWPTVVVR
mmetsp:Transcript_109616/g.327655  ORF Transcript_109616/g.327655 Transcript_109616/m.327655 type:complete len:248 (-) Transcript_109616:128-871(-)